MSKRTFSTIALIGALATLPATGCGSSDDGKPIPSRIRRQLQVQLEEARARLDNGSAGACADITNETEPDVDRILDKVPHDVDADVRNALNEGFARLFELVSNRCDELEGQQTETTPPDTTKETQPPTTDTTPPETDTTPTTPSETETTPQQPTTPDTGNSNGGDNGGGNGGGAGVPDVGGGSTTPGAG
jgi:hypothetical protein